MRDDNSDKKRLAHHHLSNLLRLLTRELIGGGQYGSSCQRFELRHFDLSMCSTWGTWCACVYLVWQYICCHGNYLQTQVELALPQPANMLSECWLQKWFHPLMKQRWKNLKQDLRMVNGMASTLLTSSSPNLTRRGSCSNEQRTLRVSSRTYVHTHTEKDGVLQMFNNSRMCKVLSSSVYKIK